MLSSGRRLMSTSEVGVITQLHQINQRRATGSDTALWSRTRCNASCVSSALTYVNGITASPIKLDAQ